jgi:hypothetical protein
MKTFKDLKFKNNKIGGVSSSHTFDNGLTISVQASKGHYCSPREDLDSEDKYSSFEVAIIDKENNFVTAEFILDALDSVIGWQSKEKINKIIKEILEEVKNYTYL